MKRKAFNSTLPAPSKPIKKSAIGKPKTEEARLRLQAKKERAFLRDFHSVAFVLFGKRRSCQVCGKNPTPYFPSQNAHAEPRTRGEPLSWERIFIACEKCHIAHDEYRRTYTQVDVENMIAAHHVACLHEGVITADEWRAARDRQLERMEAAA